MSLMLLNSCLITDFLTSVHIMLIFHCVFPLLIIYYSKLLIIISWNQPFGADTSRTYVKEYFMQSLDKSLKLKRVLTYWRYTRLDQQDNKLKVGPILVPCGRMRHVIYATCIIESTTRRV